MNESWIIEVRWGFGTKWSPLTTEGLPSQQDAERVIACMRDIASRPDCPITLIAYRDIPLRAARKIEGAEESESVRTQ
jgi:hypothetical protein